MNQQSIAAPPTTVATEVMVIMTARQGVTFDQIQPFVPSEITATVKLYLDGKIRQWYSRANGRGAVFFVDAKTVEEAHAIIDTLPFSKQNLMDHEFIPVGPLVFLKGLLDD